MTDLHRSQPTTAGLASVEEAVAALAHGRMVVVVDSEDRENEGDLVMAAERITPQAVNFMATHARGLICVPMLQERLNALRIPPMAHHNRDALQTAFHVTVDHRSCSAGISAADRALTIRALAAEGTGAADLVRPGHVFPLAYRHGGVLMRAGHTEASVDLAIMAGLAPAAVICEIASDDGTMARLPELINFAALHQLPVLAISDLIAYRRSHERLLEPTGITRLALESGTFRALGFRDRVNGREHVALVHGDLRSVDAPSVLVHSECLTGDVFGSRGCGCGQQLHAALDRIVEERAGVVVYLRDQEARGDSDIASRHIIGARDRIENPLEGHVQLGHPVDPDYCAAKHILTELGVGQVRLLGADSRGRAALQNYGLEIVDAIPFFSRAVPGSVSPLRPNATLERPQPPAGEEFEMAQPMAVG